MKHSDKEENDFGAASMMDNMLPTYAAVMANNSQSALPAAQPVARGPSDDELDEFVTTLKTQVGTLCHRPVSSDISLKNWPLNTKKLLSDI